MALTQAQKDAMAEGRRRSAARRKAMSPQDRAKELMDAKFEKVMAEFLDACLAQGKFSGLDKRTQATLLVRAMEWNIGRPNTGKPIIEDKEEPEKIGIAFT